MLSKIEKNSRKPTKQMIEKFAAFFNVSGKDLTIAFLSDAVAYQVMEEEDFSSEVFKVAEEKVEYLKTKKLLTNEINYRSISRKTKSWFLHPRTNCRICFALGNKW